MPRYSVFWLVERPGNPPGPSLYVEVEVREAVARKHIVRQIRRAVTDWVKSGDSEARAAYRYAGSDLNIGDLAPYLDNEELQRCLSKHDVCGIHVLELDRSDWNYDTPLVDEIEDFDAR